MQLTAMKCLYMMNIEGTSSEHSSVIVAGQPQTYILQVLTPTPPLVCQRIATRVVHSGLPKPKIYLKSHY